jgi:4'-phosphopantetheinyl transferase
VDLQNYRSFSVFGMHAAAHRQSSPRNLPLNVVDLWFANLPDDSSSLKSLLSADEIGRGQRYRFDRDATNFVARHGILRLVLAAYTGMPPAQLSFTHNQYGKPALDGSFSDIRFSMSQSGQLALYAIARLRDVGVDVEHLQQESLDFEGIARSFLTAKHVAALHQTPAEKKEEAFLRFWTELEAAGKALGVGIADRDSESSGWDAIPRRCFSFIKPAPSPGYVVAVAVRGGRRCSLREQTFTLTPVYSAR